MTIDYSTVDAVVDFTDSVLGSRPVILSVLAVYLVWLGIPAILEYILQDGDL